MPAAPFPEHEADRIAALRSYDVLDTQCEAAFDTIACLAARLTGSPVALVSLVDSHRQWFKARHGVDATETPRDAAFCAHTILDPGQPLIVPDAMRDPRFADSPLVNGTPNIRFYAGMPLVNPEGFALGALCVIDHQPRDLSPDQSDTLAKLAQMVMTAMEMRRAMRRAREFALTDTLTGLANRPAFLDALERTIARQRRNGDPFALLCVDLDGFKRVNDERGHVTGDDVLGAVGRILTCCVRREDVPARLGGDEFGVVLVGGTNGGVAAERIRTEIATQMASAGWPITASVGAVTFEAPPRGVTEALSAADEQMYKAKTAGKNRTHHRAHSHRAPECAAA